MHQSNSSVSASAPFLGWRMVGLGFISQNFAIGLTFGSYGVLIGSISEDFAAPRWLASLGLSLIVLLMALVAPLLGVMLDRGSIRKIMLAGACLMAAGLAAAGAAPNIWLFLLAFGALAGLGTTLLGPIPATALANNWFADRRGMVIGLVNIPLFIMLVPPLLTLLVDWLGWRSALFCMAAAMLLLLPLIRLIISRPRDIQQKPFREINDSGTGDAAEEPEGTPLPMKKLLVHGRYLAANLCCGLILAGGLVLVTHAVPYALGRGFSAQQGALLLSVNGAAAMLGAFLFGWLADRLGPVRTLILNAALQAVTWSLLLVEPSYVMLLLLFPALGVCGGGVFPVFSALMSREVGRESLGTALGLSALLILPFNFSGPPLAGYLYDRTSSYIPAFQLHIMLFVAAALLLLVLFRQARPEKPSVP